MQCVKQCVVLCYAQAVRGLLGNKCQSLASHPSRTPLLPPGTFTLRKKYRNTKIHLLALALGGSPNFDTMLFKAVFCISSYLIFVFLAKDIYINCSPFKFLFFLSIATCPDTLVWIVGDVEPGMQTRFGLHYIFKSSRSSHTRAYYIPAYQPHLAKPTLHCQGWDWTKFQPEFWSERGF